MLDLFVFFQHTIQCILKTNLALSDEGGPRYAKKCFSCFICMCPLSDRCQKTTTDRPLNVLCSYEINQPAITLINQSNKSAFLLTFRASDE